MDDILNNQPADQNPWKLALEGSGVGVWDWNIATGAQTHSAHWLAHPQFAQAVADFLAREGAGVEDYLDELNERRPFKA